MPRDQAGRAAAENRRSSPRRAARSRRTAGSRRAARVGLAAAALGAVAFASIRPIELSLEVGGGRLTVGAVRPGSVLIGAALAQVGGTVALEDVVFASPSATYRLPRIEFVGTPLGRDALAGLLDPRSAEPWPARLSRLSAERIVIPTITLEQTAGPQTQVTTYRTVVATGVAAGRISSAASEGSELRSTGGPRGELSGTVGRLTLADVDLPALVALYAERATGEAGPLKRVYGRISVENLSFADAAGLTVKVARVSGRDFLARPTRDGWDSFATAMEGASPAEGLKKLGAAAEILGAFGVGAMEFSALELGDRSSANPVAVTLARGAYAGAAEGRPAEFSLDTMAFELKDGGVRIGRVGFSGFSFAATIDGLKALAERPADELDAIDFRKLVPTLGTVRMADLSVDTASAEGPSASVGPTTAPKPERVRFGVKAVEITADRPINGVPTRFASSVDGITVPLAAGSTDDTVKRLAAIGYRDLDLSFASAADWVESASELHIRDLSLRGRDMGGVAVRATLGNFGRDAFDPDQAVAAVALLGATARSLEFTVEDKGLAERLVAQEARGRRVSPEEVRREYGVAAAVGVPALLGNSPQAKVIAQAIARFVAKPGRLVIAARAKDPAGLGAADLAALADPTAVLERLDLTARAE